MRPEVVSINSTIYYKFIKLMRYFMRKFSGGRGMGIIHRLLSRVIPISAMTIGVRLEEDSIFLMPASDSYWGSYLLEGKTYEPEVNHVLNGIANIDFTFLDAGANYGFWSVLISSRRFGNRPCLAIEASPVTFAFLETNRQANGCRFICINRAVFEISNEKMWLQEGYSHEDASAVRIRTRSSQISTVLSTTLDYAILYHFGHLPERLVIKLDVEGAEQAAIKGAKQILSSCDVLVIFECLGNDSECHNIKFMLEAGFQLIFVADDGTVSPVRTTRDGLEVKTDAERGYNFLAVQPKEDSLFFQTVQHWISEGVVTIITPK